MSTKIYDAYLLDGHDMASAVKLLQKFKIETLRPIAENAKARVLAKRAAALVDRETLGWSTKPGNPMQVAWDSIREDQKEAKLGYRKPDVDFGCEATLIEYRKKVYVMFITERREYMQAWEALPGVVDYSYWNNTDKPDELPVKEWAARERVWNGIFKGSVSSRDDAGLSIQLMSIEGSYYAPEKEVVLANLPTLEKRAKHHQLEAAANELIRDAGVEDSISAVMQAHRHPRYAEIGEELKSRLLPELTWEVLTRYIEPSVPTESIPGL